MTRDTAWEGRFRPSLTGAETWPRPLRRQIRVWHGSATSRESVELAAQPYVTPEQARARTWTDAERAGVQDRVATQVVGSPRTAVEALATLARATRADELLVTTITTEHADRVRSTELLARAWAEHEAVAA